MLRKILWHFVRFVLWLLTDTKVYGLENVPATGGYLLASNHLGILDAPLVFAVIPREDLTALVAKKHQRNPILLRLVNAAHGIWINREDPDTQAIRRVRSYLKAGGLLGMAPEGMRSKTGALQTAKTGVAYIADKASVPIIPAAITGTSNGLARMVKLQRPHITITFGEPFNLPPVEPARRDENLRANTDLIMRKIAAMLPESLRGVYSD